MMHRLGFVPEECRQLDAGRDPNAAGGRKMRRPIFPCWANSCNFFAGRTAELARAIKKPFAGGAGTWKGHESGLPPTTVFIVADRGALVKNFQSNFVNRCRGRLHPGWKKRATPVVSIAQFLRREQLPVGDAV
jgi:hypothetical protein